MDIIKIKLLKAGLNEKQIAIYFELLSAGSASIRSISVKTNINRGTTYNILKSLHELGIISILKDGNKKRFVANDPNTLLKLVDSQQDNLNNLRTDLNGIVHQLRSIYDTHGNKPLARFYEGIEGAEIILRDILSSMVGKQIKEYYVYSNSGIKVNLYDKFPDYNKQRIKNVISVKSISFDKKGVLSGLDERRWFKTDDEKPTYTLIYSGKVAFIARDHSGNLSTVLIENDDIYKTQKAIFLNLWETLPEIK